MLLLQSPFFWDGTPCQWPHLSRQRTDLETRGTKYPVTCHHFLAYICSGDTDFVLYTEPTSQCTGSAIIIQP